MPMLVIAKHRSGRIQHVSQVQSGLACECTCLDCGERLVARKGPVRDHHFGHTSGKEHTFAWESHLHAFAKQLIVDAGALAVPVHANVASHLGLTVGTLATRLKAGAVPTRQEVRMGTVRPDVLLHLADRQVPVAIEVRVTHACGEGKRNEFKRQRLAALELDLRDFQPEHFDPIRVAAAVLHSTNKKVWLWPTPPAPAIAVRRSLPAASLVVPSEVVSEPHGPPPPLPPSAVYEFMVRSWNAVISVRLNPTEDGLDVRVSDMAKGRMASSSAEHAAPRIADMIAKIIDEHSRSSKSAGAGIWCVPRWDAPAVAEAIATVAGTFAVRYQQQRDAAREALIQDLAYRPVPTPQSARDKPPRDPRDNPYARRRG